MYFLRLLFYNTHFYGLQGNEIIAYCNNISTTTTTVVCFDKMIRLLDTSDTTDYLVQSYNLYIIIDIYNHN